MGHHAETPIVTDVGDRGRNRADLPAASRRARLDQPIRLITQHNIMENYRLTARNTIVFGVRQIECGAGYPLPERHPDPAVVADLAKAFARRFPPLADVAIDRAWGGWIGITSTWLPVAGTIGDDVYYSLACNGHGLAQATYVGTLIADRIATGITPDDLRTIWVDEPKFGHAVPIIMGRLGLRATWTAGRFNDMINGSKRHARKGFATAHMALPPPSRVFLSSANPSNTYCRVTAPRTRRRAVTVVDDVVPLPGMPAHQLVSAVEQLALLGQPQSVQVPEQLRSWLDHPSALARFDAQAMRENRTDARSGWAVSPRGRGRNRVGAGPDGSSTTGTLAHPIQVSGDVGNALAGSVRSPTHVLGILGIPSARLPRKPMVDADRFRQFVVRRAFSFPRNFRPVCRYASRSESTRSRSSVTVVVWNSKIIR